MTIDYDTLIHEMELAETHVHIVKGSTAWVTAMNALELAKKAQTSHVLVPREPTQEMRLAGLQAFVCHAIKHRPDNWKEHEKNESPEYLLQMGREINNCEQAALVPYKAMIAVPKGEQHE